MGRNLGQGDVRMKPISRFGFSQKSIDRYLDTIERFVEVEDMDEYHYRQTAGLFNAVQRQLWIPYES